jgi:hypothetical protein
MDLIKAIRELYDEKKRIEQVIEHLEALSVHRVGKGADAAAPGRRGRKGMTEDEREQVSRRMKEYWAKRRKAESKSAKSSGAQAEQGESAASSS